MHDNYRSIPVISGVSEMEACEGRDNSRGIMENKSPSCRTNNKHQTTDTYNPKKEDKKEFICMQLTSVINKRKWNFQLKVGPYTYQSNLTLNSICRKSR